MLTWYENKTKLKLINLIRFTALFFFLFGRWMFVNFINWYDKRCMVTSCCFIQTVVCFWPTWGYSVHQEHRSLVTNCAFHPDASAQSSQCHADSLDQHHYGWPTSAEVKPNSLLISVQCSQSLYIRFSIKLSAKHWECCQLCSLSVFCSLTFVTH